MNGIIIKIIITYQDTYGTTYESFICYATNFNHTVGNCSRRQVNSIPTDYNKRSKKREQLR